MNTSNISSYDDFENYFINSLNKHAPVKNKVLRANNKPFMNQTIKKAISDRSRLKNKANKTGNENDILKYKKIEKLCYIFESENSKVLFQKFKSK